MGHAGFGVVIDGKMEYFRGTQGGERNYQPGVPGIPAAINTLKAIFNHF